MNICPLFTVIEVLSHLEAVILTIKTNRGEENAHRAAEVLLAIMPLAGSARIYRELPWGDELVETLYRGATGLETQLEIPYGLRR